MVTEAPVALVEIRCEKCNKFFFEVEPRHQEAVKERIFIKCYRCHHEQGGMKPPKTLHS